MSSEFAPTHFLVCTQHNRMRQGSWLLMLCLHTKKHEKACGTELFENNYAYTRQEWEKGLQASWRWNPAAKEWECLTNQANTLLDEREGKAEIFEILPAVQVEIYRAAESMHPERFSSSLTSFIVANDEDVEVCKTVLGLKSGETATFGGGAEPLTAVRVTGRGRGEGE